MTLQSNSTTPTPSRHQHEEASTTHRSSSRNPTSRAARSGSPLPWEYMGGGRPNHTRKTWALSPHGSSNPNGSTEIGFTRLGKNSRPGPPNCPTAVDEDVANEKAVSHRGLSRRSMVQDPCSWRLEKSDGRRNEKLWKRCGRAVMSRRWG